MTLKEVKQDPRFNDFCKKYDNPSDAEILRTLIVDITSNKGMADFDTF